MAHNAVLNLGGAALVIQRFTDFSLMWIVSEFATIHGTMWPSD